MGCALWLAGACAGLTAGAAVAQDCSSLPAISGTNLPSAYSNAVNTIQNNATGFGDNRPISTDDPQGSELDQMFLAHDATHFHIGLTGNVPNNDDLGNTVVILLDVNATASGTSLNTSGRTGGSGALLNMDGIGLDAGFVPEYAIECWNDAGTFFAVLHDLLAPPNQDAVPLVLGGGSPGSPSYVVDNSNQQGVNGDPGNDPILQTDRAATAKAGFQFRLPLDSIDVVAATATIEVQALIANDAGYLSNQSLPPLNPTSGGQGGGIECLGIHNPDTNPISFAAFPGSQYAAHAIASPAATPSAFDGTDIPTAFGIPAAATQNNHTCFGDAAPFDPGITHGSELDLLYVTNDNAKLYVGVTGNIPLNNDFNDAVVILIQSPSGGGTNRLITTNFPDGVGSGVLKNLDGLQLDGNPAQPLTSGFRPNFAIEFTRLGGVNTALLWDLRFGTTSTIPFLFTFDPVKHKSPLLNAFMADLTNVAGVNNIAGDDPLAQTEKARTAVKGMQFSIRLADIQVFDPNADIQVAAFIASGSGFVSNQFLPVLNPTLAPVFSSDSFASGAALADGGITTDTRTLPNAAAIERVTGIEVTVHLTHTDVAELAIDLRHDNTGRTVRLWQGNAGGGAMDTTFVEGGADLSGWIAPGAGEYQPVGSLLDFNGVDPNDGAWSLIVTDGVANGSTGTLASWTLDLRYDGGGNVGCLGDYDATSNPIDLNDFPGDQYLPSVDLVAGTSTPGSFTAEDIPAAFGDPASTAALATQNNYTCFGDAVPPDTLPIQPGSEMDRMWLANTADRLRVAISGNLQDNGNAFILMLDTNATTGSTTLNNLPDLPHALGGGGGGNEPGLDGVTLDAGFAPDYALTVQRDTGFGVPFEFYEVFLTNLVTLQTRKIGTTQRDSGSGLLLPPTPNPNGSELDQMFFQNDADHLYVGLTGNLEGNGNAYVILIETPAGGGSNPLSTDFDGLPGALRGISGDTLDAGFAPNYAIVLNRGGNNYHADFVDIVDATAAELTFTTTIGPNTFSGNNLNSAGVNDNPADDPAQQAINAATATLGVQFAIARTSLGIPSGTPTLKVAAVLVSGGGYWSNQTLPGLGGGLDNLGDNANLQNVAGDQFIVHALAGEGGYDAPDTFDGVDIPAHMGGTAAATQNNYTHFGDATLPPGSGNPNCIQVAFNNTNLLGVTEITAEGAVTAQTGMEFDIPFVELGLTPLDQGGQLVTIRAMAVLTGGFGYLSNQFLPGLGGGAPNLGNTRPLTLADYPGDQYLPYTLEPPAHDPADINGDGVVNSQDVFDFVGVLLGTNTDEPDVTNSDFNGGGADGTDVQPFIDAYIEP